MGKGDYNMTDYSIILDMLLIIFSLISVTCIFVSIAVVKCYQKQIEELEKQLDKWRL